MNIHPILVHFPVAFLSIYALTEFIRFKKLLERPYWLYVKAALVIIGSGASVLAYITGDAAEHALGADRALRAVIGTHSSWGFITVIIFGIIALAYLVAFLVREGYFANSQNVLWVYAKKYQSIILRPYIVIILALCGLVSVTFTAALGASIVYGPTFDPMVNFVYKLLIK